MLFNFGYNVWMLAFPQNSTPLIVQQTSKGVSTIRVDVCPKSSIRLFNQILNGCGIFQIPNYLYS